MTGGLRIYDGAVALVTGGASGIGRALSEELARRGASVVLADLQDRVAEAVAVGIRAAGGKATSARLDVADAAAVASLIADVAARHGRLDYLFNNAGIGSGGLAEQVPLEDWIRVIDVNLKGVVHGILAAYPRMLAQGFGHIVNTASMAGLMPVPLASSYVATKFAVVGLSRTLRVEAARRGVRVSVVCPGAIRTPILTGGVYGSMRLPVSKEKLLAWWERMRPMAPAVFAREVLDQVARNREIIIIPRWWRWFWYLGRLSIGLSGRFARSEFDKTLRFLPEVGREAVVAANRLNPPGGVGQAREPRD